jgi:hypothetical protein
VLLLVALVAEVLRVLVSLFPEPLVRLVVELQVRGCPTWTRWLTYSLFAYAVVNFLLFVADAPPKGGGPNAPPAVFRVFTGHWMALSAGAAPVQFSGLVVGRSDVTGQEGSRR